MVEVVNDRCGLGTRCSVQKRVPKVENGSRGLEMSRKGFINFYEPKNSRWKQVFFVGYCEVCRGLRRFSMSWKHVPKVENTCKMSKICAKSRKWLQNGCCLIKK